jgi:cell division protein FtsN
MKKRKARTSKSSSNGYRFLWLLTGLLIGIFACSLTFLKKKVVVLDSREEVKSDLVNKENPSTATSPKTKHHKLKAKAEESKANSENTEHYDFYTMLPQMHANQNNQAADATTSSEKIPKPTKPLAVAEQSMLSPNNKTVTVNSNSDTQPAAAVPKPSENTQATTEASTATPSPKTNFIVTAGDFSTYDQADAHKAELVLSGIENSTIEKYSKNGTVRYQIVLGHYKNQAKAMQSLQKLQAEHINGKVIEKETP